MGGMSSASPKLPHEPPTTVLVVDDVPANHVVMDAVLKDYRVISAGSGADALAILAHEHVDVVLLDVQMPGMDGYETARRIKEMPSQADTPIVFITAIFKEDP